MTISARAARERLFWIAVLASVLVPASPLKPAAAQPDTRQPHVVIFASGDVDGFLDQCGCSRYPLGGFDRRAGYINQVRRRWPGSVHVLLDVGNAFDRPGPGGDVKTRGIIEAMNELGYRAAGVGERDLDGGAERFTRLRDLARFSWLSTNLVERGTGESLLAPATIVVAGKIKIGVVAVTRYNPSIRLALPGGGRLVTEDPIRALERAVPDLREETDLIVVLASLPLEEARLLARSVEGLDLIIGAHGSRVTHHPVLEGRTRIVYASNQGKYISQTNVYRGMTGALSLEPNVVQMLHTIPPEPAMERHIISVLAQAQDAERLRLTAIDPSGGAGGSSKFVGAGRCAGCHAEIVGEWAQTGHAHAMQTLEREPGGFKPTCVPCHVTGYGQPGGYVDPDLTPHLTGVSCEACHGPAADHLADVERPYGEITLSNCTGCHTSEFDPDFDYYRDSLAVSHVDAIP